MTRYSSKDAELCGRCGTHLRHHHLGTDTAGCPWWVPPAPCGYQGCTNKADHANPYGLCLTHQQQARKILATYTAGHWHMGGRA
jgi:hypothetical protein